MLVVLPAFLLAFMFALLLAFLLAFVIAFLFVSVACFFVWFFGCFFVCFVACFFAGIPDTLISMLWWPTPVGRGWAETPAKLESACCGLTLGALEPDRTRKSMAVGGEEQPRREKHVFDLPCTRFYAF